MSYYIRVATELDFSGILDLQHDNLLANISPSEIAGGFVTTPFTNSLLERLLLQQGVFVAAAEDKIGGYALAGDWEFFSQWGIFEVMISRFSSWKFADISATIALAFFSLNSRSLTPTRFGRCERNASIAVDSTCLQSNNRRSWQ